FGSFLPLGFGGPVVVAVSAFELGVVLAAALLGLAALGRLLFRLALRLRAGRGPLGRPGVPEARPRVPQNGSAVPAGESALPVGRRVFVEQAIAGTALAASAGSMGYGALFGRHDYELSTVPMPIPGLSKAADGFTLVQISDIHLGQMVGEPE